MYRNNSSEDSDSMSASAKWWIIRNTSNRQFSAHPINQKRQYLGEYHHLFNELRHHSDRFHSYMRMSLETFQYTYENVKTEIERGNYNNYHTNPILAEEKLVVTLRYLATGCSFKSLAFSFRMGASTVGKIIKEVCAALWAVFQPLHMKQPTMADFLRIAEQYKRLWDFPNCIGSLDGKHIRIKCPSHSGSMYFNYKHFFSIVLQGLVDDHYRFISIDVGGYGKQSDGGTFQASTLSKLLEDNKLGIPEEKQLPNFNYKLPHVFIADEAYPLKENLMKPYSGKTLSPSQENFNKRLSRARKTVECAFGILFSKWRILSCVIETHETTADEIIKAICILHNIIIDKESHLLSTLDLPSLPETGNLQRSRSHNPSTNRAKLIRQKYAVFCCKSFALTTVKQNTAKL